MKILPGLKSGRKEGPCHPGARHIRTDGAPPGRPASRQVLFIAAATFLGTGLPSSSTGLSTRFYLAGAGAGAVWGGGLSPSWLTCLPACGPGSGLNLWVTSQSIHFLSPVKAYYPNNLHSAKENVYFLPKVRSTQVRVKRRPFPGDLVLCRPALPTRTLCRDGSILSLLCPLGSPPFAGPPQPLEIWLVQPKTKISIILFFLLF